MWYGIGFKQQDQYKANRLHTYNVYLLYNVFLALHLIAMWQNVQFKIVVHQFSHT